MTYESALNDIHNLHKFSHNLGLDRMKLFLQKLGNPQRNLKFIHVAGTNGKGSTTTMIASVLMEQGLKVGKYTSPCMMDFRERITINDEMIPKQTLVALMEKISPMAKEMEEELEAPREFEMITAIALCYYAQQQCDIVVLEVGIGGRFDATNAIDMSMISVIAPIGLDHTQYLGETVSEIAFEKCGIIKRGNIVVTNPYQTPEAMTVIKNQCVQMGSTQIIPQDAQLIVEKMDCVGSQFVYRGHTLTLTMVGTHQIGNAITAIEAIFALEKYGIIISFQNIENGLKKAYIPARMEILKVGKKTLILDGAHNPHGMTAIKKALSQLGMIDVVGVIGMVQDKNCQASLDIITPMFTRVITTMSDSPRSIDSNVLMSMVQPENCNHVEETQDYKTALSMALSAEENTVLVTGSLYLVANMRRTILEEYNEKEQFTTRPTTRHIGDGM